LFLTVVSPLPLADARGRNLAFVFVWLVVIAWMWYRTLFRSAWRIDLYEDGMVEFRSAFRSRRVPATEIRSIRSRAANSIYIRFSSGGVSIPSAVDKSPRLRHPYQGVEPGRRALRRL